MKSIEFKVGILILIALIVLLFGSRWFSEVRFGQKTHLVRVLFSDAGGLLVGDNVLVVGVKKGKVREINLMGREVEIVFTLDKKVSLYSDAHFSILDVAFVSGTKNLRVDPGMSGIPLDLSQLARGDATTSLSMVRLAEITVSLVEVLDLLQEKLLNEETVGSIQESIKNFHRVSEDLSNLVQESQGDIKRGAKNFSAISSKLKKTVESKEIEAALKRFDVITARLDTLTAYMNSDTTTIGKLMHDQGLYDSTKETLDSLQALISDIKKNPKRYITVKIF